jgi:CheY-like chemotaxis protein
MSRAVLDVGNCGPDHSAIKKMLTSNFDVQVIQAHNASDTLEKIRSQEFDLVLVNRKLDEDYSDGIEIIKLIKADPALSRTPVMLVSNLEEHQQLAVEIGALQGFGKLSLNSSETIARLASALE